MRTTLQSFLIFILSCATVASLILAFIAIGSARKNSELLRTQRSAISVHAAKIIAVDTDAKMISLEIFSNPFGTEPILIATYNDTSVLEDRSVIEENGTITGYNKNVALAPSDLRAGDIGYVELGIASDATFWIRQFYRNDILRSGN